MNFLPKSIVALDLHDQVVQFVELFHFGKTTELKAFNRVDLPKGVVSLGRIQDAEALKTIVRSMLEKANPGAVDPKKVAFMFPSKHVFTHIFKFPSSFSLKEIRKALVYEVETVVPFSVEEMVWDCAILEKGDQTGKELTQMVLFAGVPKSISEEYVQFFQSLGLKPVLFSIHVHAILEALNSGMNFTNQSMIIDLDPYSTTYLVLKGNTLKYILGSSDGSERFFVELTEKYELGSNWIDLWKKGELKKEFVDEIHAFVDQKFAEAKQVLELNASDTNFAAVDTIYLTGEYASLTGLSDRLHLVFPDKKVLVGDPKFSVKVDDRRFLAKHQKEGGSIPFSVFFLNAIGVAKHFLLRRDGINLLPEALKRDFFFERLERFFLIATFVLTVFMCLVSTWLLIVQQGLTQTRTVLEIQKKRIENTLYGTRYQEIHTALTLFNAEINQLSKVDQALFSVPDAFSAIEESVSKGVQITSYAYTDDTLSIELVGIADTRDSLLQFEKNLEELAFVTKVEAPLSNYDEKVNVSFSIGLELSFSDLPHYDGLQTNP